MISAVVIRSDVIARRMTGSALASLFSTSGASASRGRRVVTRPTASRTSFAAASMSWPASNSMVMRDWPWRLSELIDRIPEIEATAPSIVSVMSVSMTCGAAPR